MVDPLHQICTSTDQLCLGVKEHVKVHAGSLRKEMDRKGSVVYGVGPWGLVWLSLGSGGRGSRGEVAGPVAQGRKRLSRAFAAAATAAAADVSTAAGAVRFRMAGQVGPAQPAAAAAQTARPPSLPPACSVTHRGLLYLSPLSTHRVPLQFTTQSLRFLASRHFGPTLLHVQCIEEPTPAVSTDAVRHTFLSYCSCEANFSCEVRAKNRPTKPIRRRRTWNAKLRKRKTAET